MTFLPSGSAHAATPQFTGDPEISSDTGYASLDWQADGPVVLRIEDDSGAVRDVYKGTESSYFLSGLGNGDYRLTLETLDGEQSPPLTLSVQHQSLDQALLLTLIGALIALATVVVIVKGARDD